MNVRMDVKDNVEEARLIRTIVSHELDFSFARCSVTKRFVLTAPNRVLMPSWFTGNSWSMSNRWLVIQGLVNCHL